MEIESTSFGQAELERFLHELVDHDRQALAARLERASARLGELAARVPDGAPPGTGRWNAKEVLAHVATLSKFYGVLAYRIGTGAVTEFDLMEQVQLRDVVGEQMAQRPAAELVAMAQADHRRTAQWLRSADPAALLRRCATGDGSSLGAEEVIRLPLCSHVEQHLEQLEAALAAG